MELMDKLPAYIYVTIKYQLSKVPVLKHQTQLLVTFSVALSLIIVPTVLISLLLTLLYRLIVNLILSHRLKHTFRGLLRGIDTTCCNQERCTPSFFLLLDYKKTHEELRHDFINLLRECRFPRHDKLFYSWSTYLGYHYYYKNSLKIDDYVTVAEEQNGELDVIRTKKDFAEVINQYDQKSMPDDDHTLFHLIIYRQKIELPNVEGTKLVCLKIHHALGDGKGILGWIAADLNDKLEDNRESKENEVKLNNNGTAQNSRLQNGNGKHVYVNGTDTYKQNGGGCDKNTRKPVNLNEIMEEFVSSAKKTLFDDKIKVLPTDINDDNILLGRHLLEEKFICWFSDFSTEYIDKIKRIRKSRAGVTFLDVINTCISSSLQEYYEKHSSEIPSEITGGVVLSPAKYTFQYGDAPYTLSNEFSCGALRYPIKNHENVSKREDLLTKLNICQKEYQTVKNCIDVKYFYWLSDVLSLLPCQIPMFLSKYLRVTIGVSSLPGSDKFLSFFGGSLVKDVILMAPNSPGTALHFINCSYGNQFKISLTMDKCVVKKFEDAQEIIDGIIRNIDSLYDIIINEQ